MKNIHGTCGACGGPVTTPSPWLGVIPPTPTCDRCGRVPAESFGPVLPMRDPPARVERVTTTGGTRTWHVLANGIRTEVV